MSLRLCLLACLVATACATKDELKPSNWLTTNELENVPSLNDVSFERLENMPLQRGSQLMEKLYHISQIKNNLMPNFVPSASNIPVWIVKSNGERVQAKLSNYVEKATAQPGFGEDEVTIVMTGLPQSMPTAQKAIYQLEQAYQQRYNVQNQQRNSQSYRQQRNKDYETTSSEETGDEWKLAKTTAGNLIIIDLGSTFTTFNRYALLDVPSTGAMIGQTVVELTNNGVPREIIHLVGQGIASHVAGAAGQEFTRRTGNKVRRITGLDPAKMFSKRADALVGLSRGDADFVDAIHTSSLAMGTPIRSGDVDFYPNGVVQAVPGAQNVIEAVVRATRYFAETVRPGGERNFPAVVANSLKEYKENNGFGKRAYMGIAADYDLQGDYILEVNEKSPFGKRATAQKQIFYHGLHHYQN